MKIRLYKHFIESLFAILLYIFTFSTVANGAHRDDNFDNGKFLNKDSLSLSNMCGNINDCIGKFKWIQEFLNRYTHDEIVEALQTDWKAIQINKEWAGEKADYFHGLEFISGTLGWAAGWNGRIIHTEDGGVTWKAQNSGTTAHFLSVDFVDAQNGWVVGHEGLVLNTTDGGKTWRKQAVLGSIRLNRISCPSHLKCWIASQYEGLILATSDGGKTWHRQKTNATGSASSIFFLDEKNGWAVTAKGEFLRTTNGGKSWHTTKAAKHSVLKDVHFTSKQDGWAVGTDGRLFRSRNGGKTWQDQSSRLSTLTDQIGLGDMDFRTVGFSDPMHGWITGLKGMILATGDGGKNWFFQTYFANAIYSFHAISVVSRDRLWVSGNMGHVFVTVDSGANWLNVHGLSHLLTKRALSVLMKKDEDLFAVGTDQLERKQFAAARQSWKRAAEHGHGMAALQLAKLIRKGRGGPNDLAEASRFMLIAADDNIAEAQLRTAGNYGEGKGVERSLNEEIKWNMIVLANESATQQEKSQAQANLDRLKTKFRGDWFDKTWDGAKIGAKLWKEDLQIKNLPLD